LTFRPALASGRSQGSFAACAIARMHRGGLESSGASKPTSAATFREASGSEGQEASNWETSTGSFSYRYMRAMLLPDALKWHDHPVLLMAREELGMGELCEVMVGEHSRTIELVELIEEGGDYLRVGFRWYQAAKS